MKMSEDWKIEDLIEVKNDWRRLATEQNERLIEIKRICNLYNEKGWALNPDKIIQIIKK